MDSTKRRFLLASLSSGLSFALLSSMAERAGARPSSLVLKRKPKVRPRNIVLIVTDDQRYDALGFMRSQTFLETPRLDALAASGAHFKNAFVTTALCSPSRASILTGLYAHQHRVVDNNHPVSPELTFFPQYLQRAGYETALIGKWHMGGDHDEPQRGFDHWVSFRGQGSYVPNEAGLNVNGKRVPQRGYITDELTEYALSWLDTRRAKRPFFLMLGHKAVHSKLVPAARHLGRYDKATFRAPSSMGPSKSGAGPRPMWTQNQRDSVHGVDFPYHTQGDLSEYFKRYAETLLSVDDSVGALVDLLRAKGLLESTAIIFMSDNGFAFGEHGLIDKRTAYEESMRVPLVVSCPELIPGQTVVSEIAANIDIAATVLDLAGLVSPSHLQGKSLVPLATQKSVEGWRDGLLYEYYWERNYPQTPTMHALRENDYKYIRYHGVWDVDELFDLKADPHEENNLIFSPGHEQLVTRMNARLFAELEHTGGLGIPLHEDTGDRWNLRRALGAQSAQFPKQLLK